MKNRVLFNRIQRLLIILISVSLLLFGCENEKADQEQPLNPQKSDQQDQLTGKVTVWIDGNVVFGRREPIIEMVKKKFPDLTIQLVAGTNQVRVGAPSTKESIDSLAEPPDILLFNNLQLPEYIKEQFLEHMDGMIEFADMDMQQINPQLLQSIKQFNGHYLALPFTKNVYGLFYNKDLFDQAGVAYPKDEMTWEEVIELSKSVSGAGFLGLDIVEPELLANQWGLSVFQPGTSESSVKSEQWRQFVQWLQSIGKIPGNNQSEFFEGGRIVSFSMLASGVVAMQAGSTDAFKSAGLFYGNQMNWDVVSFPTFGRAQGIGPAPTFTCLGIYSKSTKKTEAFEVISYLLSEEIQMENARYGEATVLLNPQIQQAYGSRYDYSLGKRNLKALFTNTDGMQNDYLSLDSEMAAQLSSKLSRWLADPEGDAETRLYDLDKYIRGYVERK